MNRAVLLFPALALAPLAAPATAGAQAGRTAQGPVDQGRETFETLCTPCHTIGEGTRLGPDLQGVTERRDRRWIVRFVQHSQDVIASGDTVANRLFREYDRLVMPDQPLTEREVGAVLAYIREAGSSAAAIPSPSDRTGAPAPGEITDEQVRRGRALFQGTARLANGGPGCNSCHDVEHASVVGGGTLARDLTSAHTRLGGRPGVRAIVGNPPFPVMARAYRGRPLTDDEVTALTGFLQRTDQEQGAHRAGRYAAMMLAAGLGGTGLLLAISALLWRGRKRGTVHAAIFERQVTTT